MNAVRSRAGSLAAIALTCSVAACGGARVQTPAARPHDQVVLLPDAGGKIGRVDVANSAGSVDLVTARASTVIPSGQRPSPPSELSEAEVARLFGDVLAMLPPAPQHFTLFFRFESDELTDESRALVDKVLQSVKDRSAPEVAVVGHTDTTGLPEANYELGLKRATMVRSLLLSAGLDPSFVTITSHGEADLLVTTADNVAEPRNRRVEITVR
jgi:outer membrane protein OmpA-like peptidoglycan-associated protein